MEKISDISEIVTFCKSTLHLEKARLPDEYYYHSLPQCVIDAVFSIGVRYKSTQNTVRNFCGFYHLPQFSKPRLPASEQTSITQFLEWISPNTPDELSTEVFKNRQRTSPRGGILKSQAVLMFARVLKKYRVDYLQDVARIVGLPEFENDIILIPGQRSGISTRYFYMLSGSDDHIKPDRMIHRFVQSGLHRDLSDQECHALLVQACEILKIDYPQLTPRLLDYKIWEFVRQK